MGIALEYRALITTYGNEPGVIVSDLSNNAEPLQLGFDQANVATTINGQKQGVKEVAYAADTVVASAEISNGVIAHILIGLIGVQEVAHPTGTLVTTPRHATTS